MKNKEEHSEQSLRVIVIRISQIDTNQPEKIWMNQVLSIFQEMDPSQARDVFWYLDENPSEYIATVQDRAVEWHWKLRRTRNNREFGSRLFDIFSKSRISK
jgi:hypothetical protein